MSEDEVELQVSAHQRIISLVESLISIPDAGPHRTTFLQQFNLLKAQQLKVVTWVARHCGEWLPWFRYFPYIDKSNLEGVERQYKLATIRLSRVAGCERLLGVVLNDVKLEKGYDLGLDYAGVVMPTSHFEKMSREFHCPTGIAASVLNYTDQSGQLVDVTVVGYPIWPSCIVNNLDYHGQHERAPAGVVQCSTLQLPISAPEMKHVLAARRRPLDSPRQLIVPSNFIQVIVARGKIDKAISLKQEIMMNYIVDAEPIVRDFIPAEFCDVCLLKKNMHYNPIVRTEFTQGRHALCFSGKSNADSSESDSDEGSIADDSLNNSLSSTSAASASSAIASVASHSFSVSSTHSVRCRYCVEDDEPCLIHPRAAKCRRCKAKGVECVFPQQNETARSEQADKVKEEDAASSQSQQAATPIQTNEEIEKQENEKRNDGIQTAESAAAVPSSIFVALSPRDPIPFTSLSISDPTPILSKPKQPKKRPLNKRNSDEQDESEQQEEEDEEMNPTPKEENEASAAEQNSVKRKKVEESEKEKKSDAEQLDSMSDVNESTVIPPTPPPDSAPSDSAVTESHATTTEIPSQPAAAASVTNSSDTSAASFSSSSSSPPVLHSAIPLARAMPKPTPRIVFQERRSFF